MDELFRALDAMTRDLLHEVLEDPGGAASLYASSFVTHEVREGGPAGLTG